MTPGDVGRASGAVSGARIPGATYRLQFNSSFTFRDAANLVPYLDQLGISDIYASPILRARSTSTHGYDICDPTQLNPALGSAEDFQELVAALQAREMGLLLDTVPNHMGIGEVCNIWWMDVLENGPSSIYAPFFDIDWHPVKPEFENKVLLPVLEDQYGSVLEGGKLQVAYEDGLFFVHYHELKLPTAPRSVAIVLEACLEHLRARLDEEEAAPEETPAVLPAAAAAAPPVHDDVIELQSILTALSHLPARTETEPERIAERMREKEVIRRRIATLYAGSPDLRAALTLTLQEFNGMPGSERSFDMLDSLLEAQVYRLAFWRVAGEEINYRRFFDVNDLAAVRVEVPEVFQATHQLTFRLLQQSLATGLRIDHPDGLWDPATYFRRLQENYVAIVTGSEHEGATGGEAQAETEEPSQPANTPANAPANGTLHLLPLYVVAEKILSEREPLPRDWAVHGTTGYDFLASVNNLLVHAANSSAFEHIYAQFIGRQIDFTELVIANKILIMRDALSSEINSLSHQLERIGERNRHYRDFTLNGMTAALREVIACLPVYRTYINALTREVPERDRAFIEQAVRAARRRRPVLAEALFAFIRDTILLNNLDDFKVEDRPDLVNFVMKYQQLTGPVMAKGVEDTAFYVYNRLVSLNEVGNSPDQFGISVAQFHRDNARRAQRWPHSLLATSTHDNKRSEDVRARIDVLSEIPELWRTALARWSRLNNSKKLMVDGALAPDRNDEYLLYQTMLGTWPWNPAGESGEGQAPQAEAHGRRTDDGQFAAGTAARRKGKPDGRRGSATAGSPARQALAVEAEEDEPAADPALWPAQDGWTFLLSPSDNQEYREFQQRLVAYMQKAAREAKVHTSWITPDAEYDQALQSFVERLLIPGQTNRFLEELAGPAHRVAYYGQYNSLSQLLLKLTAPGVPDIYQGNDLWDLSLVDPDNRRPVDYERRQTIVSELWQRVQEAEAHNKGGEGLLLDLAGELLAHSPDGRIKLYVTTRALQHRRQHASLFRDGTYASLEALGSKAEYACAFARRHEDDQSISVVPRLIVGLTNDLQRPPIGPDVWESTWLALPDERPGTSYQNVFTGEVLRVSRQNGQPGLPLAMILGYFPIALLQRGG